jgi:glycosidase
VRSSKSTPRESNSTSRIVAASIVAGATIVACSTASQPVDAIPRRSCSITVWHHAASAEAQVEVVSSWTNYARPGTILPAQRSDGWRVTSFDLPAGEHTYAIVEDGLWLTDENVGTTAFHDGQEVTWVDVPDCSRAAIRVDSVTGSNDGHAKITATFLAANTVRRVNAKDVAITNQRGELLPFDGMDVDASKGTIAIGVSGLSAGKHDLFVHATDVDGKEAEPARATLWIEPKPWDWRDSMIYQVMVDRYRDGKGPLAQPTDAGGWAGGNVDGVRLAIESGELSKMGFNTIWLSPLYQNPQGSFPGNDGHAYSGYHGYWPTNSRALDPRVATESSLDALVASAHAHQIRVIFDVVPHHVHQDHAYVKAHEDGAWFTDWGGKCVCGSATCTWQAHAQDCWFAPYLPSFEWHRDDVADQTTSDVTWWLDRFDADGLRLDAVPMMPRAATRRIAADVRARFDQGGHKTFLLGENFTGAGGYETLRYQLGPFGLDGEFHFPLMWALRGAIAWGSSSLSDVDAAMHEGEADWRGSGAVMGLMIGNHDVTRFSSESAGDASGDGWVPAPQSASALVYQKQRLALGMIYTMPGAPVVYYGDELGLAGRADPDSRRVMPAESALTDDMRATRDFVSKLGTLRACSDALRRGGYRTLLAAGEQLVFARETDDGQRALVVVFRNGATGLDLPLPQIPAGSWVDALTGDTSTIDPLHTTIPPKAWSMKVLLPAGDKCLP